MPDAEDDKAANLESSDDANLGKGFAQILHDRARKASEEIHKLLLTFSAGILAVYFFALTSNNELQLTNSQKILCIIGIGLMGSSILTGLYGLFADTKRNYYWARSIQEKNEAKRIALHDTYKSWLKLQRLCRPMLCILFLSGVLITIAYIVLRIIGV
jgi:hypothetical protein